MPGPYKNRSKATGLMAGIHFDDNKVDAKGVLDLRSLFNMDMEAKKAAALRRLQRLGKARYK
jgi:hypothetical protein